MVRVLRLDGLGDKVLDLLVDLGDELLSAPSLRLAHVNRVQLLVLGCMLLHAALLAIRDELSRLFRQLANSDESGPCGQCPSRTQGSGRGRACLPLWLLLSEHRRRPSSNLVTDRMTQPTFALHRVLG